MKLNENYMVCTLPLALAVLDLKVSLLIFKAALPLDRF
jgi:hypothetical protein